MTPTRQRILNALKTGDMTVSEVHQFHLPDMARSSVHEAIERLHKAGEIHRSKWYRTVGPLAPVYRFGPGKDKPKPKALSEAQRTARYRTEHDIEVRVKRAASEGNPLGPWFQLLQR
ncbi:hypothetical protein SB861_37600 [Paraburkholderia sp. SIMBA_049]